MAVLLNMQSVKIKIFAALAVFWQRRAHSRSGGLLLFAVYNIIHDKSIIFQYSDLIYVIRVLGFDLGSSARVHTNVFTLHTALIVHDLYRNIADVTRSAKMKAPFS